MKKVYLLATALAALVSCTSDDFAGGQETQNANKKGTITFGFDVPTPTRAGGATAATALGNQFIVYGEKSETADGAAPVTDGSTTHQLVFKNYVVEYTDNTAYTTTSNTKNWEYVGKTQAYSTNVTPQAGETQTIKYWDYSATNYVFTAFSALQSDLSSGKVKVTKTTAATTGNKVYDKGYTVTLEADADPTKLYFSDRKAITAGTGTDRTADNAYGGNVTLTFRNLTSQVRVAMYETIPGYSVELDNFYYKDAASPAFSEMTTAGTDKFYANVPNLTTDKAATLTVTYYHEGTRVDQPKITTTGTANNYLALGTNLKDGTTLGADNVTSATYDKSDKSFTSVFPQESNSTNLKLKVDYTLKNATTGENIHVVGATAEVPADYLKWKPNFKYTYIFKISDNTNGSTGHDVVGLYPITFDAIEIVAEDGNAEYITTVSEPSITTFGVNSSTGKYVAGGSEYAAGSDIYATIMDGSAVKDFTLGTDVNVYLVTTADKDNFPITEASVAEALAEIATGTKKITYELKNADGATSFTAVPVEVTTVPGEDGVDITGTHALKLTGAAATIATTAYAIEYIKTPATYNNNGGSVFTLADQAAFNTEVSTNGKIYTNTDCTTELTWSVYEASPETTYYRRKSVKTVGTYAYKVIRVQ